MYTFLGWIETILIEEIAILDGIVLEYTVLLYLKILDLEDTKTSIHHK